MRLILAVLSLVLAVALLGVGVAQRTVLRGPDTLTVESAAPGDAVATVIDGKTLTTLDGSQDIRISGEGAIFAAAGRTSDVIAWLGDADYNTLDFDPDTQELRTVEVDGAEDTVPSPVGSDLWLREYTADSVLDLQLGLDEDLSIVVLTDGTAPAPSTVSISWRVDNSTPFVGPLITAGVALLALAALLFLSVILGRGPRRGPGLPVLDNPARRGVGAASGPKSVASGPRAVPAGKQKALPRAARAGSKRMLGVLPIVVVPSLLLGGCSADLWPSNTGAEASASPSAVASDAAAPEEERPPVATVDQIERIVGAVTAVAASADTTLDAAALGSRFAGPALEVRTSNFALRAKDASFPSSGVTLPAGDVTITLPERSDTWPRTIFAVTQNPTDATVAPVALVLTQESARENYKAVYSLALEPNAVLPALPAAGSGTARLSPDTKLLSMQPAQLLPAYVDVMNNGSASASFGLFDIEKDLLLVSSGAEDRAKRKADNDAGNRILESVVEAGGAEVIALATNDTGALVTATVTEKESVRPKEGFELEPGAGQATFTLAGVTQKTAKGLEYTFGDQLLFYIPPVGSTEKTVLLGFSQGLTTSKELP